MGVCSYGVEGGGGGLFCWQSTFSWPPKSGGRGLWDCGEGGNVCVNVKLNKEIRGEGGGGGRGG